MKTILVATKPGFLRYCIFLIYDVFFVFKSCFFIIQYLDCVLNNMCVIKCTYFEFM